MVLNERRRSVSVRALSSGGRFLPPWRQIDAEPRHAGGERLAALGGGGRALGGSRGGEGRHLLGRRDVRVVLEVDQGARQRARDLAPLLKATDAVAHECRSRCSRSAAKGPAPGGNPACDGRIGIRACLRGSRQGSL